MLGRDPRIETDTAVEKRVRIMQQVQTIQESENDTKTRV